MSIILYGVTSGGTSVPIEVTEEGKLVVDTSKFPTDEFIKQGDDIEAGSITASGDCTLGPQVRINGQASTSANVFIQYAGEGNEEVFVTKGDGTTYIGGTDISSGSPAANIELNQNGHATFSSETMVGDTSNGEGVRCSYFGEIKVINNSPSRSVFTVETKGTVGSDYSLLLLASGEGMFAAGQAGFTSDGELYFYSRGTRYKAVVQGGNVAAEPYTRATELREKAQKLREPRTQDIVPKD